MTADFNVEVNISIESLHRVQASAIRRVSDFGDLLESWAKKRKHA